MIVSAESVRDYLELNSPGSSSKYSDATIGSNILAAQSQLEQETHCYLSDHPATTWATTTMLQAQVPIPRFRNFSTVNWGGSALTITLPGDLSGSGSCWAIPDDLQTGTYVAIQFRAWRADSDAPWWLADRMWFDKLLDSPFYPGNRGGGYAWTSLPNDLVIIGDGGYAAGTEPPQLLHAVKVLAGFFTMRPASILADVAITPQGGVINYTRLPQEVLSFISDWRIGKQAASM